MVVPVVVAKGTHTGQNIFPCGATELILRLGS